MRNILFILSLIIFFTFVFSDELSDILNNLNTDFLSRIDKTAQNINTETIQYGLSYDNSSVVKVFIKLVDEGIKNKVNFVGFLKSKNKKEYILNCSNPSNDLIVCVSEPGLKLDTEDRYYMYYNRSRKEKIIFDYEDILEDDKRINLIFNPELYVNQTVYRDNKKVMAQINKKTVGEGYLYIVNQRKKILNIPKDRFNKYIELNNFVFQPELKGYKGKNMIDIYEEAIRRGYHMIEAEVQFTNDKIPIIYNKKNEIYSITLEKLQKKQKILTLLDLLKKCKEKNVIVELKFSFLDFKTDSHKNDEYAKIIMKIIEENEMFDSLLFNVNKNQEFILKLIEIKNDISVCISNINKKEDINQKKDKYKSSKRIIFNLNINSVNEELVKYISNLGHKIKVSTVNNEELANKLQLWGVNYITTNNLPPFLIQNEKDEPFRVKCVPIFLDDLSECKMGNDIILRDNEYYNIHYSLNIYNKSEDINETAIGEFRYEDTKINDMKYYIIKFIDFKRGLLQLIMSHKVEKGKIIKGIIGPKFDNVAESYQYNFICEGNNQHFLTCEIEKDSNKVEFKGEYVIYYIENYSYNEEEIEDWGLNKLKSKHIYSKQERIIYTFLVIAISLIFLLSSYYVQNGKDSNAFDEPKRKKINFLNIKKKMHSLTDADGNKLMYE